MKMLRNLALVLLATTALSGCETQDAAKKTETTKKAEKKAKTPASQPSKKAPVSQPSKAPSGSVTFSMPPEGAKVFEDFQVGFKVMGKTVKPAGQMVEDKNMGHHHIIVDGKPIPSGTVVPKDGTHIHFGGGQTTTTAKLAPGKHTLTMQFADGAHISYGAKWSKTITVNVVPNPAKAPKVMFLAPADGAKVKGPIKLKFGLEGMTVRPAGEDPLDHTTGHHHIIVDGKPIPLGAMVAKNATHIHYGKGQTEAELTLKPGPHTLTLQLADGAHRSYGPALSTTIKIEVE